jgi:hypothetical protein
MSEGFRTTVGLVLFVAGSAGLVYGLMFLSNQLPLPVPIGLLLFIGSIAAMVLGMEILESLGIHPHF